MALIVLIPPERMKPIERGDASGSIMAQGNFKGKESMDEGKLEEKMKTKTIIILALIAFTFGCASMKESGEPEEAVSTPAAQEVEPSPEPVAAPPEMVSVIASVVNIRSGPGTENKVVTTVRRGDELEMLGEMDSWYNVKLSNGVEGWIHKKLVK